MAREIPLLPFTLNAGEDLSDAIYCFLDVDTDGNAVLATAGGRAIGVCQNNAEDTHAVGIEMHGISICRAGAGGGITAGMNIAVGANGKAVEAGGGDAVVGIALDDAANEDEYFTVALKSGAAAA